MPSLHITCLLFAKVSFSYRDLMTDTMLKTTYFFFSFKQVRGEAVTATKTVAPSLSLSLQIKAGFQSLLVSAFKIISTVQSVEYHTPSNLLLVQLFYLHLVYRFLKIYLILMLKVAQSLQGSLSLSIC